MTAFGSSEWPSPATWPFSCVNTVCASKLPLTSAQPVFQLKFVFSAMSASGVVVPHHVTPKVQQPLSASQATSLLPSKNCGPGHSRTSEGQRLVSPPYWKAKEEVGTLLQVAWLFRRAVAPPPLVGSLAEL